MTEHDDNLRHLMSEAQLDAALADLHSDVPADEHTLAEARAQLVSAAGGLEKGRSMSVTPEQPVTGPREPARRHRGWLVAAAATFAAVVASAVVIQAVPSADGPPALGTDEPRQPTEIDSAADVLLAAARNVDQNGEQPGPGQYLYVNERAWWANISMDEPYFSWLAENLLETWVPADHSQEWMEHRDVTGEREWLIGTEEEAKAAGEEVEGGWPEGEHRATCGDFYAAEPDTGDCGDGDWGHPTPRWIDGLPREPEELLERLREDTGWLPRAPQKEPGETASKPGRIKLDDTWQQAFAKWNDSRALWLVAAALRSGLLPADVRSALYEALALMPGIEITEDQANLDGRKGTAIGMPLRGGVRLDIIVDYETGDFIGERQVATEDNRQFEPGTVLTFTTFDTAIVDEIGQRPSR